MNILNETIGRLRDAFDVAFRQETLKPLRDELLGSFTEGSMFRNDIDPDSPATSRQIAALREALNMDHRYYDVDGVRDRIHRRLEVFCGTTMATECVRAFKDPMMALEVSTLATSSPNKPNTPAFESTSPGMGM